MNRRRTWAIARNDLLQILRSRDFLEEVAARQAAMAAVAVGDPIPSS